MSEKEENFETLYLEQQSLAKKMKNSWDAYKNGKSDIATLRSNTESLLVTFRENHALLKELNESEEFKLRTYFVLPSIETYETMQLFQLQRNGNQQPHLESLFR